ncbi:PTS sugar transporter subunit IIC [Lacticaseibacillus salsurivasis]|uniref:PTS sugar transporter subunit IIC n=1 Tax=Lacticaseibacillus salsurivasis TaxID=3081441 RepID=UPI0030C68BB9
MDSLTNKLQEKLIPFARKLDTNRYLTAIKSGFLASMPLLIIGSVFLLFENIPWAPYTNFMVSVLGKNWAQYFSIPFESTFDIMTLFVIIGMAKSLGDYYKINAIASITISLATYLVVTPDLTTKAGLLGIPKSSLGSAGLFLAMVTVIGAIEVYRLVAAKGWTIKMPDSVPLNVAESFSSLIPGLIVILLAYVVRLGFQFTDYGSAQSFIYKILQIPLLALGSTLPAQLVAQLFESVLWSIGIHGGNVVGSVMDPIRMTLMAQNAHAFSIGAALPNIIQYQFGALFISIGGSGTTIGLAIAGFFFMKSRQYKAISRVAFVPALFNISEPIIFGFPIILNPILIIPFIITPLLMTVLTYFVMATGIVPPASGVNIPWTTPAIISGFLVSGWRGAVWQAIEIALSTAIYYPFLHVLDVRALQKEQEDSASVNVENSAATEGE